MKILILQTGNYSETVEFPKISKEINKRYAEINGYDYKYETFEPNLPFLNASIYRYAFMLKYFDSYDLIVYIDTDAVFNNPNIKIETLIDEDHYIYVAPDNGYPGNNLFLYHIGNMFNNIINKHKSIYIDFYKNLKEILLNGFDGYRRLRNYAY